MILALAICSPLSAEGVPSVSEARREASGLRVHDVRSEYQDAITKIRVLLPDKLEDAKKYPAIYVLPVEAGTEHRYGDGMLEIQKLGLHNQLGVVFVGPTFSQLPWYADHPTNPTIRQESYLLEVVLPFIEGNYPVRADGKGRLLLGFSKSGWGAWSLLLRHPDRFSKAAAWDAPLMMDAPGKYGSGPIFGSAENFEHYRVSRLLEKYADRFRNEKRLVLLGYGNFRPQHVAAHEFMEQRNIAHEYHDGPERDHDWHSGWVKQAVELLVETQSNQP